MTDALTRARNDLGVKKRLTHASATLVNSTKGASTVFILVLFLSCFFLASVVPPLQSPDEFDHMKRAYLLTKGQFVLDTPVDAPSGGMIDTGLITYLEAYQPFSLDREVRVSSDLKQAAEQIPWTDREEFSLTPGTGYYFPAIYAPQALGLFLGKNVGLTVHDSYTLSRFFTLAVVMGLLLWAVRVQPPSYAALALLALPISLLQIASPTIDGISTALSVLAVSLFLKMSRERVVATRDFVVLCLAVLIVASSRAHLLSMVLLLFGVFAYSRNNKHLIAASVTAALVLGWTMLAAATTVGYKAIKDASTVEIIQHYLLHPGDLLGAFWNTVSNEQYLAFYGRSFFGILGGLDTAFTSAVYIVLAMLLAALLVFSLPIKQSSGHSRSTSGLLLLVAAGSVFLVFFALLVTWSPFPATVIEGVQGRYFLVPVLILVYAFCVSHVSLPNYLQLISALILSILVLFSINRTADLLLSRYYVEVPSSQAGQLPKRRATAPLNSLYALPLNFLDQQRTTPHPLTRIGIQLGTYGKALAGKAELRLMTASGYTFKQEFDLKELADNQYKFFELDGKAYTGGEVAYVTGGEVAYVTGGGISIWEVKGMGAERTSCLVYDTVEGKRLTTPGCTAP